MGKSVLDDIRWYWMVLGRCWMVLGGIGVDARCVEAHLQVQEPSSTSWKGPQKRLRVPGNPSPAKGSQ